MFEGDGVDGIFDSEIGRSVMDMEGRKDGPMRRGKARHGTAERCWIYGEALGRKAKGRETMIPTKSTAQKKHRVCLFAHTTPRLC
jgi:hypothetical protein